MKKTRKTVEDQIKDLKTNETLLVGLWATASDDKVQLELAEKTQSLENNPGALLQLLNADDARFSSGARRAWKTASILMVGQLLNINCGADGDWVEDKERGKKVIWVGEKNPTIQGQRLRLVINETTTPTEYDALNIETSAKRKGADGDFITHGGKYIFSNTDVVLLPEGQSPKHVLLQADSVTMPAKNSIQDEVGM